MICLCAVSKEGAGKEPRFPQVINIMMIILPWLTCTCFERWDWRRSSLRDSKHFPAMLESDNYY